MNSASKFVFPVWFVSVMIVSALGSCENKKPENGGSVPVNETPFNKDTRDIGRRDTGDMDGLPKP